MSLVLAETFPVGPLGCNCAVIADPETKEAIVLDPGDDAERILEFLRRSGLRAVALVHTHAHFDHVGVTALMKKETGAPIFLHEADRPLYARLPEQGRIFGFHFETPEPVDRSLADGDRIPCGGGFLEVLHTPGHTPGSVCLYDQAGTLFSGDTLFEGGPGTTAIRFGDFEVIIRSISEQLLVLPGETAVHTGHGPSTTIGAEAPHLPAWIRRGW
jgi:glyoxylase-like metal-dependent hydrolase (beta-lactamase superfamily II)